jgi:dienelactone hydrolase
VEVVFQYLRSLNSVSSIGLWGRSMGAVTSLMYVDKNPEIACIVLDSPFSNLEKLCS